MRLITVNGRGVPVWAILASTVIGFLSVIAAYVSPDTVFTFLLNSSGAVILFVYLLIARLAVRAAAAHARRPADREDVVLPGADDPRRRRHRRRAVQMVFKSDTRSQLLLSLLSWGVVLVLYADHPLAGRLGRPPRSSTSNGPVAAARDPRARQPDDGPATSCTTRSSGSRAATGRRTSSSCRRTRSTPARPTGRVRPSCGRPPPTPRRSGSTRRWRTCAGAGSRSTASSATTGRWSRWTRRCASSVPTTW